MIDRRTFLACTGAVLLAAPLAAEAQQVRSIPTIGYLGPGLASSDGPFFRDTFLKTFRELGYTEGQNTALKYRWADGHAERLPALAAELVGLKVNVIVTAGTTAIRAAKEATTIIPIVMAGGGDPVGSGIVASLARPGGNINEAAFESCRRNVR